MYKNSNLELKKTRTIDGIKVPTIETEISRNNTLSVEAGTTGYMGGGYKKGGRTFVKIVDLADSHIIVEKNMNSKGFVIRAGGDSELDTLINAFSFIADTLKKQKYEKLNNRGQKQENSIREPEDKQKATEKQIAYIKGLLKNFGYKLIIYDIPKPIAKQMITELTQDPPALFSDKYEEYIIKE